MQHMLHILNAVSRYMWILTLYACILRKWFVFAQYVYNEMRPFALCMVLTLCATDILIYPTHILPNILISVINILVWWKCMRNDDDDDDRWRKRSRRLREKITALTSGRLVVEPA